MKKKHLQTFRPGFSRPEFSIALIYLNMGLLWIFFSDQLLANYQTQKGFIYVFLTAGLLWGLVRFFNQSLQRQRAYYRLLFLHNPLPMWNCDPSDGQILDSNQAACSQYGYSVSEFASMRLGNLEKQELDQACQAWHQGLRKIELELQTRDAQTLDVQLHFQETPEGLLVTAYDLQEHKQVQERLFSEVQSLQHFQQTIQSASVLALLDAQSRILESSSNLTQLSGLSQTEIVGRRLAGISRSMQPEWSELMAQIQPGIPLHAEVSLAHGWVSFLLLKYTEDQQERFLLLGQEITSLKNLQTELWAITRRLVDQNQDLRQFARIVSHNLRAPVANLLGLSELLKDAEAEESLLLTEKIHDSAEQIDSRLRELNTLLQKKGSSQQNRTWIDLPKLLQEVQDELNLSNLSVSCEIRTDFQLEKIYGIAPYLHSILFNLLANAFKYRDAERPLKIQISTEILPQKILLKVSDNGLGIDLKQFKDQVFGLYKRFHPEIEGHGLGLYLVKTQTEMLGGKIEVESALGQGTTFLLYFPQLDPDQD